MKRSLACVLTMIAMTVDAGPMRAPDGPIVIHDAGGTRPLMPLAKESGMAAEPPADLRDVPLGNLPPSVFPVVSRKLTPGEQPILRLERPLPPVCLIGDDPRSLAWLEANHGRLVKLGASCMAVSVADERAWHRILRVAAPIPVAPIAGDEVARLLGIGHYPVLIGPEVISP